MILSETNRSHQRDLLYQILVFSSDLVLKTLVVKDDKQSKISLSQGAVLG